MNRRTSVVPFFMFCLIVLSSLGVSERTTPRAVSAFALVQTPRFHIAEDGEGRDEWFRAQRVYPSDDIPTDAYENAYRHLNRTTISPLQSLRAEWRPVGPAPTVAMIPGWGKVSGRINAIAVSPADPRTIFVGGATGGVWRTTDGGSFWLPLTDTQPTQAVGSIAIAPSDPRVIYVGTGDANHNNRYFGAGVLKSTDGGLTWKQIGFAELGYTTISKVVVDPTDADRVFVGVATSRDGEENVAAAGVWTTRDGGNTWQAALPLPGGSSITDLAVDPGDPTRVYAAAARPSAGDNGVYRSTDGGQSWRRLTGGLPDAAKFRRVQLALAPSRSRTLFVSVLANEGFLGIFKSGDGGDTWAVLPGTTNYCLLQCWYNQYLAVDPTDADTLYLGEVDLLKSTNGGVSWTNLTPDGTNIHPDHHAIAFDPRTKTTYFGCDGGLYASRDGGRTFVNLNGNLSLTQHVAIALHPTDPGTTFTGTQDNGTQRSTESTVWRQVTYNDGGVSAVDFKNPQTVFATMYLGNILRSDDGGENFYNLTDNRTFLNERIAFYSPLTLDPTDSSVVYTGTHRLWRSRDGGFTWTPTGDTPVTSTSAGVITTIAAANADPRMLYVGTSDGAVSASTDAGATFIRAEGLPNRFVTRIAVDPTDARRAFVTVSGFGTGHVFKTSDGGKTFRDVSRGLPNIPANVVLVDPGNSSVVYLGTDLGMFRSSDGGETWTPFNRGLPFVIVTDIAANPVTNVVRVATYGRGVYELAKVRQ